MRDADTACRLADGTFAIILAMKRNGQAVETIRDFSGLARTNPMLAFFMAMLLFSLAGVPPLAGFFAKFYVFMAAVQAGLFTLAVVGVLLSVVGACSKMPKNPIAPMYSGIIARMRRFSVASRPDL